MQPRVRDLGLTEYTAAWEAMRRFTDGRTEAMADEIWLLEHPPVFTLGLGGKEEHLLDPGAIPVVRCDRGGQVTYHGPGQLVVYVLADLRRMGWGVKRFVNALEQAVIDLCVTWRILARRRSGAPGVYLDGAKVAAIGLRVRRGCTFHGLALNVNMDLSPFRRINPCGYAGLRVTQLYDQGVAESMSVVKERLIASLLDNLGYDNQFDLAPRGMNPAGRPKGRAAPLPFGNPIAKVPSARPRGINLTRSLGREDR